MDIGALLITAGGLMLTGMVSVFIFLLLLILITTLMSNLTRRFFAPAPAVESKAPYFKCQGVPNEHVVAITAAIAQYKNNNQ